MRALQPRVRQLVPAIDDGSAHDRQSQPNGGMTKLGMRAGQTKRARAHGARRRAYCRNPLAAARKLATSREILLWMTPSEAPKALQASECSELLDPMRASCWISAQH